VEMIASSNATEGLVRGKNAERVALRTLDRDYRYGALERASAEVAAHLRQVGLQMGDRVLLVADNSFFWVASYLGTLRAGMISVPLPVSINPQDFEYVLQTTEARFGFIQARFASLNKDRLRPVQIVSDCKVENFPAARSFTDLSQAGDSAENLADVSRDDLAALMFTSGSTGKPHGVMVSHGNIMANTHSIIEYLGLTEDDRIMTVLPFHYCFGTSLLHTHLSVGASLVLDQRFMYPDKILDRMIETECTGFAGVPSHFQILLRKSSIRTRTFPHLRYVQQAGGHLAPSFIQELREVLPTTKIFVMYGQTEATARLSYVPPERLDEKVESIGKPIPGVTLRVVDESGRDAKPGEIGEIVAEGANVTQGYWRASEETAISFRNGKLYTGDIGRIDDEGFFYLVGRNKDFIKCGGKRISCRQIEDQIMEMGDLLEAAVVGVPDEVLGEAVKAFVVPRAATDGIKDRVMLFCRGRLPLPLVPKEVVVLDALPRNSSGKILKHELKDP